MEDDIIIRTDIHTGQQAADKHFGKTERAVSILIVPDDDAPE